MNRDAAVSLIQEHTGWRTTHSDQIVTRLIQAQRLLEKGRSLPYFLLEEDQTLSLPSGSADVSLPTGFLREKDDQGLYFFSDTELENVFLEKVGLDVGLARFANTDAGHPQAYALRKTEITFFPERDVAYDLTWSYYKADTTLESNVENKWLLYSPDVLIGLAGSSFAAATRDQGAQQYFNNLYQMGWAVLFGDTQMREDEGRPLYMGARI